MFFFVGWNIFAESKVSSSIIQALEASLEQGICDAKQELIVIAATAGVVHAFGSAISTVELLETDSIDHKMLQ